MADEVVVSTPTSLPATIAAWTGGWLAAVFALVALCGAAVGALGAMADLTPMLLAGGLSFVGAGAVSALCVATSVAFAMPWRVRIDQHGVRRGRLGLGVIPAATAGHVRLSGSPGRPVRYTLADGTLLHEDRDVEAHGHVEFSRRRVVALGQRMADVLGVPLVDELAPAAEWSAHRRAHLDGRQQALERRRWNNRVAHDRLHRLPPVEPDDVAWGEDRVEVRLPHGPHPPGSRYWSGVAISRTHLVSASVEASLVSVERAWVEIEQDDGWIVGTVRFEFDGRAWAVARVRAEYEHHVAHLHWLAATIERLAAEARARTPEAPAGADAVPEALQRLRATEPTPTAPSRSPRRIREG